MEETERFFSCPYCKVKLLIASPEAVSYYLGETAPDDDTLFIPYRRNTGMDFMATSTGTTCSNIDKTSLALALPLIPHSLGVRSQALRLRFVTKQTKGMFPKPEGDIEDKHLALSRQAILPGYAEGGIPTTFTIRRFLSHTSSFIFSPYRILGRDIYDGISMDTIGHADQNFAIDDSLLSKPATQITFTPAVCPNCGIDLDGSKESIALPCTNCGLLWESTGNGLMQKPFLSLPSPSCETILLPFWRIKANAQGFNKSLRTDPRKSVPPSAIGRPILFEDFYFWVPAFFISPPIFLRLSERASLWQPHGDDRMWDQTYQNARLYPVTIPASQAGLLLTIILSQIVANQESILECIVRGVLEPVASTLVFVPFAANAVELIHPEMRLNLLRTALQHHI